MRKKSEKRVMVFYKGKYLVETPDWNGGKWTEDRSKATVYEDDGFFQKYYPSMELLVPTPEEVKAYDIRREEELKEIRRKRIEREKKNAEYWKSKGINLKVDESD